jgi:beta-N-acetylhexosaminidase
MGALDGSLAERTRRALDAGCDLALHCSGILSEMEEVAEAAPPISPSTQARVVRGEAMRRRWRQDIDRRAAGLRLAELIAGRADRPTGRDPTRA